MIAVIDATDLSGGAVAGRSPIVALPVTVAISCGRCWLLLFLFRPGGGVACGAVVVRILIAVHS